MWAQDKLGNFKQINGLQSVKLSPESNSIRFKARFKGFIHSYVVGDFNDWKKLEKYRLTWMPGYNDGSLRMTKDISFDKELPIGRNEYTYILVDIEGNEFKLSLSDNHFEPFYFTWQSISTELEIKSSENYVTIGFPLDLVAVKDTPYNHKEVARVSWTVYPRLEGIEISNGRLTISTDITNLDEIKVKCYEPETSLVVSRTFKINYQPRQTKLVHFIKMDDIYYGNDFVWNIWAYNQQKVSKVIDFAGLSDFGVVANCDLDNVIIRKKTWGDGWDNEWSEQTRSFHLDDSSNNFYIIYGDNEIYTSLKDVVTYTNPKIEYAVMNNSDKIIAYLSHEPLINTKFDLYINSIKQENVIAIVKYQRKQVIFTNLPTNISPQHLVEIRANNTFLPIKVIMHEYLNQFYYSGDDLGVKFSSDKIFMKLWAPTASKVELLLYNKSEVNHNQYLEKIDLKFDNTTGVHAVAIERSFEYNYYLYRLSFKDIDHNGLYITRVSYAVDPYASSVGLNGEKGYLVDINSHVTMVDGWLDDQRPPLINKEDSIIYELHLRDISIFPESGISARNRGKFCGLVETGTSYTDASTLKTVTTGIDSIKELGVTHIHLLPFFDFATVDEFNLANSNSRNWGYDPKNFNAPDGSYSTNPHDPLSRIKETRAMVHGLHREGLRVVMDIVYNHMYDTVNMDAIVPGYYFRNDYLGHLTNGSGCGNELATERPMVGKFVLDSILHWINDYHLDGIRFDLMELIDFATIEKVVKQLNEIDPTILVYGEPWKAGDSPLVNGTYRGRQKDKGFSIFNDAFRDAIRGNNNPGNGFVNGDQHNSTKAWTIVEGLKGSINSLTVNPGESINYVDAHDNYTLWDQIEKSQNHSLENGQYRLNISENVFDSSLVRQNLLALGIVLTAQGIPFIHGGSEMLRTKNGDHNSYISSDEVNAFYWQDKVRFKPVFDYVKGLIQLRKEHPAFRITDRQMIKKDLNINIAKNDSSGVITTHFKNHVNNDPWRDIFIIYNATTLDDYLINDLLPLTDSNVWNIVVDHERSGTEIIDTYRSSEVLMMRSFSMLVMWS